MPLYHSSPVLLGQGSIILPGNYGRIIRSVGATHPYWDRENTLESVRRARYDAKPSRLDATFSCPSKDTAVFYAFMPTNQGRERFCPPCTKLT
jgi:hypothetical protein